MNEKEKKPVHRHTKGPWEYKESRLESSPNILYGMVQQANSDEWIAECQIEKHFNSNAAFMETHRANWNLMAAAPFMFDFFLGTFLSMGLKVAKGASKSTQQTFLKMSGIIQGINPEMHDSIIDSIDGLDSYNVTGLSTPGKMFVRKKENSHG